MSGIDTSNSVPPPRGDLETSSQRSRQTERAAEQVAENSATTPSTEPSVDAVSFTQTVEELQSLEAQLRDIPGVDMDRVASIRQAIEDGSYSIDTERLVDSLIQTEQDLS
ncbi:MAG: flagellar biosynthesis anti-sigma factor FlgM [Pseudomonadota bacterium]